MNWRQPRKACLKPKSTRQHVIKYIYIKRLIFWNINKHNEFVITDCIMYLFECECESIIVPTTHKLTNSNCGQAMRFITYLPL